MYDTYPRTLLCGLCVWISKLFYSDCGSALSTVRTCNMSAGDCQVLFNRTRCIEHLYFDADVNTLYWIEANIIMSFRLVGLGRRPEFVKSVFKFPIFMCIALVSL